MSNKGKNKYLVWLVGVLIFIAIAIYTVNSGKTIGESLGIDELPEDIEKYENAPK